MPISSLRIVFRVLILNSTVPEGDNGWKRLSGPFGSVSVPLARARGSRAVQNRSGSNDARGICSTKHYCDRLITPFSETWVSCLHAGMCSWSFDFYGVLACEDLQVVRWLRDHTALLMILQQTRVIQKSCYAPRIYLLNTETTEGRERRIVRNINKSGQLDLLI